MQFLPPSRAIAHFGSANCPVAYQGLKIITSLSLRFPDFQREKYQQAWKSSSAVLRQHPLTDALSVCKLQHWLTWAEWMVQHFHRSSSAVEGRNGSLSKMYHNGRGISESRLKALTVIHNYGLKRRDGTTAAQRFFEQDFPDLFLWILDQMGGIAST